MSLLTAIAACGSGTAAIASGPAVDAEPTCAPSRVVVFTDVSHSSGANRTPVFGTNNLDSILNWLSACGGGELALGLIAENSNLGLLRVLIPAAPLAPLVPAYTGTAFQRHQARVAYQDDSLRFATALVAHRRLSDSLRHAFRVSAEALLQQPRDARRTDVWGAIGRAALFLNEPHEPNTHQAVLLISDFEDNVRRPAGKLPVDVAVLVVNGQATSASQSLPQSVAFESVDAAIALLINRSRQ